MGRGQGHGAVGGGGGHVQQWRGWCLCRCAALMQVRGAVPGMGAMWPGGPRLALELPMQCTAPAIGSWTVLMHTVRKLLMEADPADGSRSPLPSVPVTDGAGNATKLPGMPGRALLHCCSLVD